MQYKNYWKQPVRNGKVKLPRRSLETFLKNQDYTFIRCVRDGNLTYIEASAHPKIEEFWPLPVEEKLTPFYIQKIVLGKIKIKKDLLKLAGIEKYAASVHVGNYSLISNIEEFIKSRRGYEEEDFESFYWILP